jgi:hypothetical protein
MPDDFSDQESIPKTAIGSPFHALGDFDNTAGTDRVNPMVTRIGTL